METIAVWPVLIVVAAATVTDLRNRRIPNWLTLPFLLGGLALGAMTGGATGFLQSAAGAGLAVLLLVTFCLLKGMGWGDLKLCAAVGAWVGPAQLWFALVATAMAGGLIAVGLLLWRGVGHKVAGRLTIEDPAAFKLPYAPAIAIGTVFSFLAK